MLLKICGMTRQQDITLAEKAGFDFCGFIFHPGSPRNISALEAAQLDTGRMKRVGVFVNQSAEEIMQIMQTARLDFAQLHGSQSERDAALIGADRVIRVMWPERCRDFAAFEADAKGRLCRFILLDSGTRGGGSGRSFSWEGLSGFKPGAPWFLAGGLGPENVPEALLACCPDGLDFNSGLETAPGIKNSEKILAAAKAARLENMA